MTDINYNNDSGVGDSVTNYQTKQTSMDRPNDWTTERLTPSLIMDPLKGRLID